MRKILPFILVFIIAAAEILAQGAQFKPLHFNKKRINRTFQDTMLIISEMPAGVEFKMDSISASGSNYFSVTGGNWNTYLRNLVGMDTIKIPVQYKPRKTQNDTLSVSMHYAGGEKITILITGTGTAPIISLDTLLDFGAMSVGSSALIIKNFRIKNENYEFADTLTVTGLAFDPVGAVSSTKPEFGAYGFRYDHFSIFNNDGKIMLAPGATAQIFVEFSAKVADSTCVNVSAVSDAVNEAYSRWCAFGLAASDVEENFSSEEIFVSPNPANDFITVHLPERNFSFVELYSALGEKILSQNISSHEEKISLENISAGVYYVKIAGEKFSSVRTIVVTK